MRILELFCGTKSVSKAAVACGYGGVVSVDVNKRCSPTICVNILDFEYKLYPVGFFHFVWASPPCTEFSRAKTVGVRKIAEATRIVEKTLEIIKYLQPAYFCIENPVGLLRLQPCMAVYERYLNTVSYCRYGFQYRKNTNLWTNVEFDPQKCVKGSLCKTKEKTGYHAALCQSSHNGKVRGRPDSIRASKPQLAVSLDERYSIPLQLLTDIFKKTKEKRVFFRVSKRGKVHFSPPHVLVDTMQSGSQNALLEGACDDADNELTEVQKAVIEMQMKTLQARFKRFEEKSMNQKVDELQLLHKGLCEEEAGVVLHVCSNNEFEAADRLGDPIDGDRFIRAVRSIVRGEQRVGKLKGRAVIVAEEKLARRRVRLMKRKGGCCSDDDEDGDSGSDPEDWTSDEEYGAERREKPVTMGRLKLDDALKQRAATDITTGWSEARIKAWDGREKNENAYFYRFNAPGETQSNNHWSDGEHAMFMETLMKCNGKSGTEPGKCDYVWGIFSKCIPGRVGYQCSNYYRTLVKLGTVEDKNYTVDNQGVMRFNFKTGGLPSKPTKKRPSPNPKLSKQPAAKKPKFKKKGKQNDDDKPFYRSVKVQPRNSGCNAKTEDVLDEPLVLPGFMDPLTRTQVEQPAISPYGHVCGYETWCRVLRNADSKDTCPFTRQLLRRRDLVKLTHKNVDEFRCKMVETQS